MRTSTQQTQFILLLRFAKVFTILAFECLYYVLSRTLFA